MHITMGEDMSQCMHVPFLVNSTHNNFDSSTFVFNEIIVFFDGWL